MKTFATAFESELGVIAELTEANITWSVKLLGLGTLAAVDELL